MNEQTIKLPNEVSFNDFLFKNKLNKTILKLAAVAIVIQFLVFKYLYPYASFIHGDSFVYLDTAYHNFAVNTYMVGYSRFLRLFSSITSSDTILVGFQYLLIQVSSLGFLFTLFYFYNASYWLKITSILFIVLNPLFLHLGNLISSDGFFFALSVIWFTLLLWIIHKPSNRILIWHTLILLIVFTVRYNALIYPFITALALFLSPISIRKKLLSFGSGLFLCGLFVCYTGFKFKKITGTWQYSPFSGWQLANNAMYTYRYVDSAKRKPVPERFRTLDNMVRNYFDTSRNIFTHPQEMFMASTAYMWDSRSVLYTYRDQLFKKDTSATELKKWSSMGPFYKDYGLLIIKQYPIHFMKYFLWPNANKYYAPPVEFLEYFNSGRDSVGEIAQAWFGYKSQIITTRMASRKVTILNFYLILTGITNMVFVCSLICFLLLRRNVNFNSFNKAVILFSAVWLINAVFTISASAVALRFQAFPIILVTISSLFIIDRLIRSMKIIKDRETLVENIQKQAALNTNISAL